MLLTSETFSASKIESSPADNKVSVQLAASSQTIKTCPEKLLTAAKIEAEIEANVKAKVEVARPPKEVSRKKC